ncbi:MAG TPA: HAMP domain-containing sensor histidine kinase [Dehalococcoidia bacterium]|nr:HAMP domain-containing sensor histidine kinase [Dehalococcoidia bacterium]
MPRRSLFSFRTLHGKLIAASVLLVIGALVLASGVFVALTHGKEKQRALDHTTATAPQIHGEFLRHLLRGESKSQLQDYVREAAQENDVRIIMFDYSGIVVEDTAGELEGRQLQLPVESAVVARRGLARDPSDTWHTTDAGGGSLTLVAPFPALIVGGQRISISPGDQPPPDVPSGGMLVPAYRIAMAVSEGTITRAWLDLLPWLALAAAAALPFAIGSAIVIARNITRPLSQLTVAADQMAQGTFDIDVPTERRDEVGQLSRAFSAMATNVGETHMKMRALVADVSHDMRTPLTSILGFAQALRGGVIKGEAESKHAGEVIYDEVAKLSERLNDLLFLSEIEAGQALLQREDVELSGLVAPAVERIRSVDDRGITISCNLAPHVHILADRAKLERVVENLLDNARKFTPSGGDIEVSTYENDSGAVCLDVANTATDIEAEELPKLFERFYRRDAPRTGRTPGSGLGLPIARDLAELHGGTLQAHLADGMVVFRMTIPRGQPPGSAS